MTSRTSALGCARSTRFDHLTVQITHPSALNEGRNAASQSISQKGYENLNAAGMKSASLGHVKLADRMEKREPGTGPVSGDRVAFVVVKEAPHLANLRNRTIAGVTYAAKDWPPRHERCVETAHLPGS